MQRMRSGAGEGEVEQGFLLHGMRLGRAGGGGTFDAASLTIEASLRRGSKAGAIRRWLDEPALGDLIVLVGGDHPVQDRLFVGLDHVGILRIRPQILRFPRIVFQVV